MTCPASFYRARCQDSAGHPGQHHADAGAGTLTIWTDPASDPTPAYQDHDVTVHLGDCVHILPTLPDNSVDAVITDPPYGLDFMGKHWDTGAIAFDVTVWTHCLRVLKPGAHLLAFGGTRTWHRLAAAIEDAGFEIRDSIAWLYGSGFPKSLDVSKAIDRAAGAQRTEVAGPRRWAGRMPNGGALGVMNDDAWIAKTDTEIGPELAPATDAARQWAGWGTALKPAFEPIIVARKPLKGTVAQNVLAHGTGALNIDACRIAHASNADLEESQGKNRHADFGSGARDNHVYGVDDRTRASQGNYDGTAGRWPTNVTLDNHMADELDKQSGTLHAPGSSGGSKNSAVYGIDIYSEQRPTYSDSGGASRFFPTFKYTPKAPTQERPTHDGTTHPTVKPLDLIRWLIRLTTPPHGLILDPFAGTGTTAEGAIHEHKKAILIERETTYLPLIKARLHKPIQIGFDFDT